MNELVDIHQHIWTAPLIEALAEREELPFVRSERGLTVLYLAGERPYVIDLEGEQPERRAELVEQDGLERALVCLSSPLGIESLPREDALPLIAAYHEGALALGAPFGVWGAIALDRPRAEDVEETLSRGCVGIALPAGAVSSVARIERLEGVLGALEQSGAPLFVHPGPASTPRSRSWGAEEAALADPLWWPAMTRYVASVQSAWLALLTAGRARHPKLRICFAMLAGLAPLHHERLSARGCQADPLADRNAFYETSSYGPGTVALIARLVGEEQILYGSDRPVVDPAAHGMPGALDREAIAAASRRALAGPRVPAVLR